MFVAWTTWLIGALAVAAEAPARSAWPDQLGPMTVSIGDVGTLRVPIAMQLRADVTVPGTKPAGVQLDLKRLRAGLDARFLDDRLAFKVQLNLVPGKLELIDLFAEGVPHPEARLRVGWMKVPLTRYREQSATSLGLVDWAQTTRAFGGERQLGAMVVDGGRGGLVWAAGVFTGANSRASHGLGLVDAYGLVAGNPSDLLAPVRDDRVRPEVVGRVGYATPGVAMDGALGHGGDRVGVYAAAGMAWDAAPEPGRDFATRLVPEVAVTWRGLWANAMFHLGVFEPRGGGWALGMTGLLLEVGVRPHRFFAATARLSRLSWTEALRDDVAASLDGPSGLGSAAWEVGGGVELPVVGESVELAVDALWHTDDADGTSVGTWTVRSQLQLAF